MGLAPTNLNLGAPSNASLGPLEPEAEAREANPRLPEDLLHPASAWKIGKPEVRASILPGFKVQCWVETAAGRLNVRRSSEALGLCEAGRADAAVFSMRAHGMETRYHQFPIQIKSSSEDSIFVPPLISLAMSFHCYNPR